MFWIALQRDTQIIKSTLSDNALQRLKHGLQKTGLN